MEFVGFFLSYSLSVLGDIFKENETRKDHTAVLKLDIL